MAQHARRAARHRRAGRSRLRASRRRTCVPSTESGSRGERRSGRAAHGFRRGSTGRTPAQSRRRRVRLRPRDGGRASWATVCIAPISAPCGRCTAGRTAATSPRSRSGRSPKRSAIRSGRRGRSRSTTPRRPGAGAARRRDARRARPAGRSRASRRGSCRTTASSGSRSRRSRRHDPGPEFCDLVPPGDVPPPEECTPRRLPDDPSMPDARRSRAGGRPGGRSEHRPARTATPRSPADGSGSPRAVSVDAPGGRGDDRRVGPAGVQPGRRADDRSDRRPHDPLPRLAAPARTHAPTTGCSRRSAPTPRPTASSRRTVRSGAATACSSPSRASSRRCSRSADRPD